MTWMTIQSHSDGYQIMNITTRLPEPLRLSEPLHYGKGWDEEKDPSGKDSSTPGAKLDAGKVRPSLILSSMPRAILAVAEVGTFGAEKYSKDGWLMVDNGIERYTDAMDRHRLYAGIDGPFDPQSKLLHAAHEAWNALARLELMLQHTEAEQAKCS